MLNEGEEIILDRHPHWSFLIGAALMVTASVFITIILLIVQWELGFVGLILIAIALIGFVGRWLRWITTEFALTTDRIIVRTGILNKNGVEIPLERVMNISYSQKLYERMLGTGDLVVESAGENGHQRFSDVSDPYGVQNLLYRQMEIASNGQNHPAKADGLSDEHAHAQRPHQMAIPEQIAKLDELRSRGILSDEEFQEKKRQLLDRM